MTGAMTGWAQMSYKARPNQPRSPPWGQLWEECKCRLRGLCSLGPDSISRHNIAGETFAATSAEYFSLKQQLESESFAPEVPGGPPRFYSQLPHEQRAKLLKERLKKYTQRVSPRRDPTLQGRLALYLGARWACIRQSGTSNSP